LRLIGDKILWLFSVQEKTKSNFKRQSHKLNGKTASTQTLLKTERVRTWKFTFLGQGWEDVYEEGIISTVMGRNNAAGQWNM